MTTHIHDAIILGAGYGGLGQAAVFAQRGIRDFVILEQADALGGVWRDNTYPGAACDTQSVIYCYSYFLHLKVTRMFSGQTELLGYLEDLADEFGLRDHLRLGRKVVSADWVEEDAVWRLQTESGETFLTRAFVPAWGQLSTPSIPDFPGLDDYQGTWFHSAEWNHDVPLAGRRVATVGNAATAVQAVPELAKTAESLTVFQRSANYILPRNQQVFTDAERERFLRDPEAFRDLRRSIHDAREAGFERTRSHSSAQEEGAAEALAHLHAQIADPELRAKLTPDFEFGCKRILRSDDFYPALTRDNVRLDTTAIERFTERGIRTVDGVEHELDVVIFATGFRSQAFHGTLRITGRDGRTLDERWGTAPEAYLGMAVDGFPNLFIVYGPNTNLNHNSVVSMLELQHEYIAQAVAYLSGDGQRALDVRPDVLRAYNDLVQSELERSAYSSDCSSWYKNAEGRVINNWCGTVEEYRDATGALELGDYGIAA